MLCLSGFEVHCRWVALIFLVIFAEISLKLSPNVFKFPCHPFETDDWNQFQHINIVSVNKTGR